MLKSIVSGLIATTVVAHQTVSYTQYNSACTEALTTPVTYTKDDCVLGEYKLHHCDSDVVHMYKYTGEGCTGGWYGVYFKNGECGDQMKLTCQGKDEDHDNALDDVEEFIHDEWRTIAIAGAMDLLIAIVLIVMILCCMRKRRVENQQEN